LIWHSDHFGHRNRLRVALDVDGDALEMPFQPLTGIVARREHSSGASQDFSETPTPALDRLSDGESPIVAKAGQARVAPCRAGLSTIPTIVSVEVCARADGIIVVNCPVVAQFALRE
jgi:hypothetical protein